MSRSRSSFRSAAAPSSSGEWLIWVHDLDRGVRPLLRRQAPDIPDQPRLFDGLYMVEVDSRNVFQALVGSNQDFARHATYGGSDWSNHHRVKHWDHFLP